MGNNIFLFARLNFLLLSCIIFGAEQPSLGSIDIDLTHFSACFPQLFFLADLQLGQQKNHSKITIDATTSCSGEDRTLRYRYTWSYIHIPICQCEHQQRQGVKGHSARHACPEYFRTLFDSILTFTRTLTVHCIEYDCGYAILPTDYQLQALIRCGKVRDLCKNSLLALCCAQAG